MYMWMRFLLTRPSRDVTVLERPDVYVDAISTHTPLAGRDDRYGLLIYAFYISTHTPLAGRDHIQRRT